MQSRCRTERDLQLRSWIQASHRTAFSGQLWEGMRDSFETAGDSVLRLDAVGSSETSELQLQDYTGGVYILGRRHCWAELMV